MDSSKLQPRKKFTLQGEIKVALARFKHQSTGVWQFKPSREIMKRFVSDYTERNLYVRGSPIQPLGLQRYEVLTYMQSLPTPDDKSEVTGRRIGQHPLFYDGCKSYRAPIQRRFTVEALDIADMLPKAQETKLVCDSAEQHLPYSISWRGGIDATMVCVFEEYYNLLKFHTVKSAYIKLLDILKDEKFANLDSDGIYYALMHIICRGVDGSSSKATSEWRKENSQDQCFKYTHDYTNGIPPPHKVNGFGFEIHVQRMIMRAEMVRLRMPSDLVERYHHYKIQSRVHFFLSWFYGVYEQFTAQNKKMISLGVDLSTNNNYPTMFKSIGQSAMEGAFSSPEFNKILTLTRQMPEVIGEKIDAATDRAAEKFEAIADRKEQEFAAKAEEILRLARQEAEGASDSILNKVVSRSGEIAREMLNSFEPALDILDSFRGMLSGLIDKVSSFLTDVPGFGGITISLTSVMEALKYYILYINTNSTSVKMILIGLILNSFGIIKTAFKELLQMWTWAQGSTTIDGQSVPAQETGLLDWMSSSTSNFLSICGGLLAYLVKGTSLTLKEFSDLCKGLGNHMRSFHFIGAGMAGLGKIFDYFKRFWSFMVEWIMKNIFGRTSEKVALAKRVTKNVILTKYFSTEAGLNAMRSNERVRLRAESLMPEWLALLDETRRDPEYRNMFMDLERQSRTVKEIADAVSRFRSTSNFQPTMFHVQLVGRPGIGKSTLMKNLVSDLSRTLWPEDDKPSFYPINMSLDYFDGYAGQRIMIADDMYKMNEPKHLTTSIGLITNTPVILPMANLNDKGMQLVSDILLSTTNEPYPQGKDILCIEAVHRRRHLLVDVICDPRVIDPGLGQFSLALFNQYYPGKKVSDFDHLTFDLIKPVPREFGGASKNVLVTSDEHAILTDYAKLLKEANQVVRIGKESLPADFYFSENEIPEGLAFPAVGWKYSQLISNCAVRYRTFRGMEGSYQPARRFAHVEQCLAEIDNIFDQNDDLDGPEFPRNPLIEQFFTEMSHPFGSDDPVGERLADGEDIAPELDNINFDDIVNEILSEDTPTGITLAEERERTRLIIQRKKKRIEPTPLKYRMRMEKINGKYLIPMEASTTVWDGVETSADARWTSVHGDYFALLKKYKAYYGNIDYKKDSPDWILGKILWGCAKATGRSVNSLCRDLWGSEMVYPSGFGELSGTPSGFPVSFFRNICKIEDVYYFDATNYHHPEFDGMATVMKNGSSYQVPMDFAFALNENPKFRLFMREWDCFTDAQKDLLIRESQWRSMYMDGYTYDRILEDCTSIFSKLKYKTLSLITSPVKYIFENYPAIAGIVGGLLAYFATTWVLRKVGELFSPKPTSKYLHRGPASGIVYRGHPTAAQNYKQLSETLLKRNVKKIIIKDSQIQVAAHAFQTEQFVFLNAHLLRWLKDDEFSLIMSTTGEAEEYLIDRKHLYIDPEGDLAVIYSRNIPSARKMDHHFLTRDEYLRQEFTKPLTFLSRGDDFCLVEHFPFIGKVENLKLRSSEHENFIADAVIVSGHSPQGKSGSTALLETEGQVKLIGLQAWQIDALYSPKVAIQVITQEKFSSMTNQIRAQVDENIITRTFYPEHEEFDTPTGAFEFVKHEHLVAHDEHVVGDVGRNQIKPSMISSKLTALGIETKRVPAAMSHRDKRLYHAGDIHPMAHSLGKYYRGRTNPISSNILNRAKHMLSTYIASRLDTSDFSELDLETTITGTREDGSNPMNLSSSPGIPFIFDKREKKGKKDYIEIDEFGEVCHLDQNFVADYLHFENTLAQGQVPYTRAYDFPKDELRPIIKALGSENSPPKTRSVTCMNLFYIMAWRRYTLRFWAAMHRAADGTFSFCPGINPEGPEWNNLFNYLNRHPNAVDFDVSNWDGFYFSQLFYSVLDIIKQVMRLTKSDRTALILDSIFYDVMNCYIQYLDVIYQKPRGLVSGFPGTAEVNTLGHWLLALCFYLKLTTNTIYGTMMYFLGLLSIAVYGDDILFTISDEIIHLVNGTSLKDQYELIGYPVTSASKSTEVEFSKPLLECRFLKSTWRELFPGYMIRKLDMDVANDLVHWIRGKENPEQQFYENYVDALRIAFGNGKQEFEKFVATVNRALSEFGKFNILYFYEDFEYDYMTRYFSDFKNSVMLV